MRRSPHCWWSIFPAKWLVDVYTMKHRGGMTESLIQQQTSGAHHPHISHVIKPITEWMEVGNLARLHGCRMLQCGQFVKGPFDQCGWNSPDSVCPFRSELSCVTTFWMNLFEGKVYMFVNRHWKKHLRTPVCTSDNPQALRETSTIPMTSCDKEPITEIPQQSFGGRTSQVVMALGSCWWETMWDETGQAAWGKCSHGVVACSTHTLSHQLTG